jgi:hypothetical protein
MGDAMQLSANFVLDEFLKSQQGTRLGLDNTPSPAVITALKTLCERVLEPVRKHFGRPMAINSGYRSPAVNKAVGGAADSQHVRGEAADIEIPGLANGDIAIWIRDNLAFDQLILEAYRPGQPSSGWVHVSFTTRQPLRKSVLTATPKGNGQKGMDYRTGLFI